MTKAQEKIGEEVQNMALILSDMAGTDLSEEQRKLLGEALDRQEKLSAMLLEVFEQ